jgi:predicted enzyme related to lactoylglutathione lyase
MPVVTTHLPGSFCWIELATSDAQGGRKFYTDLFGWSVNEIPMGEEGTYLIFQKGGREVAAMYQLRPDQKGMPSNWMSYVAVASADESAKKAKNLGATVVLDPFDVFDMGRMAVLMDPQGGAFSVWQPKQHGGIGVHNETDTFCWDELQARDLGAAKKFYTEMFGWRLKESDEYTEVYLGPEAIGGMMTSQAPPEVPSYWMPYFAVDDCDGKARKAQKSGAIGIVPPTDIPNAGRFAVLQDPQGAVFAIIKLMPAAPVKPKERN